MIKILVSIVFALVVTSSFSLDSFAVGPVNSTQKNVAPIDNDTAQADNKQEINKDTPEQTEKQVKTRPRRRR